MRICQLLLLTLIFGCVSHRAEALPAFADPGFETGFSGWSSSTFGLTGTPSDVHSGSSAAFTGAVSFDTSVMTQTLTGFTVGTTYDVSFWVQNTGEDPSTPQDDGVQATLGGTTATFYNTGLPYVQENFSFTATSTSALFSVTAFNKPDQIDLDDFAIAPKVPELDTTSAALPIAFILGALGLYSDRRRNPVG